MVETSVGQTIGLSDVSTMIVIIYKRSNGSNLDTIQNLLTHIPYLVVM